jgi:two-component system KDP operon response regulator KdpE
MKGRKPRILVFGEDAKVIRYLRRTLEHSGYETLATSEAAEAQRLADVEEVDLILLDITLVEGRGFDLFREIRRRSGAPIITVASEEHVEDAVHALRAGADDYVTKPLSAVETSARVEAALRRREQQPGPQAKPLQFDELVVDPASRLATTFGNPVALTATENRLLLKLADSAGRVLTHDEILESVWGPGYAGQYDLVRCFVRTLRKKLGDDARKPRFIFSERGVGYRMAKPA